MLRVASLLFAASLVACRTTPAPPVTTPAPPVTSSSETSVEEGPPWTWTALEYFEPSQVADAGARKSLALALAEQARRPSMTDLHKALYALTTLAEGFPDDRQMLLDVAALLATDIAARSVPPNVGGAARGLLATLGAPPPVPLEGSLAIDPDADSTGTLQAYIELFNAHDPEAMAAACHPELEVWYVDGGGVAGLGTAGPAALKSELDGYFANYPDVRSDPTDLVALDDFVWFVERVNWADKSQASPAVYQFEDGKLRRAWYHPAVRD
jgi:hypothetical protein